jgi:hypothetical protein
MKLILLLLILTTTAEDVGHCIDFLMTELRTLNIRADEIKKIINLLCMMNGKNPPYPIHSDQLMEKRR